MFQVLFCSLIALAGTPKITETASSNLSVIVPNIKGIKGEIVIAIYRSPEQFPKIGKDYRTVRYSVNTAVPNFKIKNLEPGEYAVAIYHDENADGECNCNFLGIPKEGYGFSNNVKPRFSAPPFEACKINLSGNKKITIRLIY